MLSSLAGRTALGYPEEMIHVVAEAQGRTGARDLRGRTTPDLKRKLHLLTLLQHLSFAINSCTEQKIDDVSHAVAADTTTQYSLYGASELCAL